jgi:hypothetical protein
MTLADIFFEAVVELEKTVWRQRDGKIKKKDVRRVVAANGSPVPCKTIKVTDGE